MLNLLFQPFKQCFDFKGRATRMQFWSFVLGWTATMYILILIFTEGDLTKHQQDIHPLGSALIGIVAVIFFITQIALTVRRLHDSNRSGLWWFIQLIPIIGTIWIFILMCLGSTKGANTYGPAVKY